MATIVSMKDRFPEFVDIPDARIQLFLDDAMLLMANRERWLDFYEVALSYFAAHLLYVGGLSATGDGGVIGPLKRQEVDDVVIEQAVAGVKATAEDLLSSTYGKRYYQYRRLCFTGIYGV
jgi:hypothetical protein